MSFRKGREGGGLEKLKRSDAVVRLNERDNCASLVKRDEAGCVHIRVRERER